MRQGEPVFVDSGAWIALALARDPLHGRARAMEPVAGRGSSTAHLDPRRDRNLYISRPERQPPVALTRQEAAQKPTRVNVLHCELRDLAQSSEYFRRAELHKLSAVDPTGSAVMKRARIRLAYRFDHHSAVVGFRLVG
jgi:predicted nucleic acid-binding protein